MHPNLNNHFSRLLNHFRLEIMLMIFSIIIAFLLFTFFNPMRYNPFNTEVSAKMTTQNNKAESQVQKRLTFFEENMAIEIDSERLGPLPKISSLKKIIDCNKKIGWGFCIYASADGQRHVAAREMRGVSEGRWQGLAVYEGIAYGNLSRKTVEQADLLKIVHAEKYVFRASEKNLHVFQHYFCLVQNSKDPETCP